MGQKVKYIAQQAQDDFEQNYAGGTSFFTLDDYIARVADVAADIYRKMWKEQYDEIRSEKRQEVVGFEPSVLSEQFVKVKKVGSEWVGDIEHPALSLPFDQQSSGFSNVFDVKTGDELERSNINETWMYRYLPFTGRLFYRIDRQKVKIFTKGDCNIQEVRILYVPSIQPGDEDAEIPDGMSELVTTGVVNRMRELAQGTIVKKTLDQNANKIMETELNKKALQ